MGHFSRRPCSGRHAVRLKGGFFRDSPMVGRRGHRAGGALAEARGRHFPPRGPLFYQKAFYQLTGFLAERPPRKLFQLRPREEGALCPPIRVIPRPPCDAVRDVCTSDLPFALPRMSACNCLFLSSPKAHAFSALVFQHTHRRMGALLGRGGLMATVATAASAAATAAAVSPASVAASAEAVAATAIAAAVVQCAQRS